MKNLRLMDSKTAKAAGYCPLTTAYRLPHEQAMVDNVLADMRRGKIDHRLVKVLGGVSVWRRSMFGRVLAKTTGPVRKQKVMRPRATRSVCTRPAMICAK
ncbi:MAG: hypothetical protein ACXWDN_12170 [Limisphaerales bacterium]